MNEYLVEIRSSDEWSGWVLGYEHIRTSSHISHWYVTFLLILVEILRHIHCLLNRQIRRWLQQIWNWIENKLDDVITDWECGRWNDVCWRRRRLGLVYTHKIGFVTKCWQSNLEMKSEWGGHVRMATSTFNLTRTVVCDDGREYVIRNRFIRTVGYKQICLESWHLDPVCDWPWQRVEDLNKK